MEAHGGHRQRLLDEYLAHGGDGFPDHRFLELLLTYAIPRKDTNALAHRLLTHFGSLEAVLYADTAQLLSVEGVGKSTAAFLHMQGHTSRRLMTLRLEDAHGRIRLTTPLAAAQFGLARLGKLSYECVELVCLNAKRYVEHIVPLHTGLVSESPIYPRQVAEIALLRRAHSLLLFHNHPSGNPIPSTADKDITETVRTALSAIGVSLLDHIIVGAQSAYSFSAGVVLTHGDDINTAMTEDAYRCALSMGTHESLPITNCY